MSINHYALLSMMVWAAIAPVRPADAQPLPAAPAATPASASELGPYGWWYSKNPDPFSRPPSTGGGRAPDGPAAPPADAGGADGQASSPRPAAQPATHSFALNRSPVQSLYLAVKGAARPETAPEVYYRFTARTLERHGGVALGSSWHQAEVGLDGEAWRADLPGVSFGTVEVYSRFRLGERRVYSQHNYLHFLRSEDAEGLQMPARTELPGDWPQFVFPTSSYNDMPFRGARTGQDIEFEVRGPAGAALPTSGKVIEDNLAEAGDLVYSALAKKFSYQLREDELLAQAGRPGTKKALAVIALPDSGDLMTFSFNVSRSRWSTRKLGLGLGGMAAVGAISAAIVIRRRRRFKYNDRD
ncbi:MAG: hypothetical protein LBP33_03190 [Candidatus Adiutrix sp.]|jgi:hypothetical protein|nr:hypothetical protein [Candidatus Adiutrix sp.]